MQEQIKIFWKKYRKKVLLAGGVLVSVLAVSGIYSGRQETSLVRLSRPSVEEGKLPQSLVVVREDGSRSEINVNVNPRKYSLEEVEVIFEQVLERLPELIKGQNPSLTQIQYDLILPDSLDNLGVDLIWQSTSLEVIGSSGKLREDRVQSEAVQVNLQVTMSLQGHNRTEEIILYVLPPEGMTWEERLAQELIRLEAAADGQEQFELPVKFEGEEIAFVQQTDTSKQIAVALLPMVITLFFYMKEEKVKENQQKQRQEQITADYPELVVKMTVLYQAGMSMRNVWERIAADERKKGEKLRPIYEEVSFACNSMADGVPETEAYRQFGRRCSTAGCLKLGNMLAGNVRRGTRHLTAMMAEESARAWEQRKHLARRSGEKAGTKMLLPMFMMFGVVLAMVVVPAFYGLM